MVTRNLLLNALSPVSRDTLLARAQPVDLPLRTVLYQPGVEPRYAYFLTTGIASVVTSSFEGGAVEVGVIGSEGLVGSLHLLGPALTPTECFMQLPGSALRIRFHDLRRAFQDSPEIRSRVLECVQVRALTLSQIAGCHRLHNAEQRLARWLLMVQDRVQQETLALTQEFLAEMLGSQRTTVSAVAALFQKSGLIEYTRGNLSILDRPGLEAAACGCYAITRELLANLYLQPYAPLGLYFDSSQFFEVDGA